MCKAYAHMYASSALTLIVGFLLIAMDLAMRSQGVKDVGLLSLVDYHSPAIQAGVFLLGVSVYHFVLGIKLDANYQSYVESTQKLAVKDNFLDIESE